MRAEERKHTRRETHLSSTLIVLILHFRGQPLTAPSILNFNRVRCHPSALGSGWVCGVRATSVCVLNPRAKLLVFD